MKKKLLRCMSILCTAALLSALPYPSNLMNVQADSELDDEIRHDDVFEDNRIVSKDGRFRYVIRRDKIIIVGYIGEEANIKVPAKIDGKVVSSVGFSLDSSLSDFDNMSNNEFVKQITFPDGINVHSALASNVEKISFYSTNEKNKNSSEVQVDRHANLKEVDLRQVSSLSSCLFRDCTGLKTIYLPSLSISADSLGFYGCTNLSDVYYDDTENRWADVMGQSTDSSDIPDYKKEFYRSKKHFKAEKSPNGVYNRGIYYNIGSYPSDLDYMAENRSNPAKECYLLMPADQKTVKVPDTVVLYESGSPVKVTSICVWASQENNPITNITIGKNVTRFEGAPFSKCPNLKKITIRSTKLFSNITSHDFEGIHPNAVIKVPKKQLAAYKKELKRLKVKVIA